MVLPIVVAGVDIEKGMGHVEVTPAVAASFDLNLNWPLDSQFVQFGPRFCIIDLKNSNRSLKIPISSIEPELNSRT